MGKNILKLFDLTNKVAIVTGGSRGLGRGMSLALAGAGANVVIIDTIEANSVKKQIESIGRGCVSFIADVTKPDQVENVILETVKKFTKIDILVNNAGIAIMKPTVEFPVEEWEKVIKVNLEGTFICCQAVGKVMLKQKSGKIINISSVRGLQGRPGYSAYAASKAGVNLLTKSLACEWGPDNVYVNAIAPTFIHTEMNAAILDSPENYKKIINRIPLGRFGKVEDLYGALIFLASDASNFVTGTVLYVDGGWTSW